MHLSNGQVGAGSNLTLCIYSRTHIDHIHTLVRYNRISISAELQWRWIEYGDKFTVPVNFRLIFSQCHMVPYFSVRTLDIEDSLPPAAGKADQCFSDIKVRIIVSLQWSQTPKMQSNNDFPTSEFPAKLPSSVFWDFQHRPWP